VPADVQFGFAGAIRTAGFTEGGVYSDGVPLPVGRLHADGVSRHCIIHSLYGYVSGKTVSRSLLMYLGSTNAAITVAGNGSQAVGTGWIGGSSQWFIDGQPGRTGRFGYTSMSGACWFQRDSSASVPVSEFGFPAGYNGMLSGNYRYAECPSAPNLISVTPSADGTSATLLVGAQSDDGGNGVTAYRIQRATNAAFTTGVATVTTAGSATITGLTPGVTYYWRVTAVNGVTVRAGTLGGTWSVVRSALQPTLDKFGKIHNGSSFVDSKAGIHNGSSFVKPTARIFNGASWVPLP
jgi:hypothetical protein